MQDCEDCATRDVMLDEINSQIHLEGNLTESAQNWPMEIATRCPISRTTTKVIGIPEATALGCATVMPVLADANANTATKRTAKLLS